MSTLYIVRSPTRIGIVTTPTPNVPHWRSRIWDASTRQELVNLSCDHLSEQDARTRLERALDARGREEEIVSVDALLLAIAPPYETYTLTRAMHASLHRIYDPRRRGFVKVGSREGDYGPVDDRGAEFRCLGQDVNSRGVRHSKDYQPGGFYPHTVFVTGRQGKAAVPHERLELFLKVLGYSRQAVSRVVLPRGIGYGGAPLWEDALMLHHGQVPTPMWEGMPKRLGQLFPTAEVEHYEGGAWTCVHGELIARHLGEAGGTTLQDDSDSQAAMT